MKLDDAEINMILAAIYGAILGTLLGVLFFLIIPRWW